MYNPHGIKFTILKNPNSLINTKKERIYLYVSGTVKWFTLNIIVTLHIPFTLYIISNSYVEFHLECILNAWSLK